jgi:membrane protein
MNAYIRKPLLTVKTAAGKWMSDQASSIGAALAFYCAFSLAPLLIIIVAIAGWIVGPEVAHGYVGAQLTSLFGKGSTDMILQAMSSARTAGGLGATMLSIATLLIGATTVLTALESALEQIWGAKGVGPAGWRGFVRTRLLSFGIILAIGFILLVSLTITTGLAALRGWVSARFTGFVVLIGGLDFVISISLATVLVALIYRYLPPKRLPWRQVLLGAFVTALLFFFGRWAIGLYLGKSTQPTAFGAAASFAALLLWLYYSAQIFLFGAEITAVLGGTQPEAERANASGATASAAARGKKPATQR